MNDNSNLLANVPFKNSEGVNNVIFFILFVLAFWWVQDIINPPPTRPQPTAAEQARSAQAFEALKTDIKADLVGYELRSDDCFNEFAVGLTDNITPEHASAVGINLEELKSAMVSSAYHYRSDITEDILVPLGKFVVTTANARDIDLDTNRAAGNYAPEDELIQEWYRNNAVDTSRIMTKVYNRANLNYWTPEEIVENWSSPEV